MSLAFDWRRGLHMNGGPGLAFEVHVPDEMKEGMTAGGSIAPRISRSEALQVPAVLRSRNLIAGTLARLPVHIRDKDKRIARPIALLEQINPDVPNVVTYAFTYEDLLFEGISWWRITQLDFREFPMFAEHIDHQRVAVWNGEVYIDGRRIDQNFVIRFDSPNPPLLVHAARAIRSCLELDKTASNYANDPVPLGYFTPREESRVKEPDKSKVEKFLDDWKESRRRRAWGWVPGFVEGKQFQFTAEQIQLANQRQHAVLEIARAAGIDPEDLGVSTTSRTYQNSEQRRQDLLDFTLAPYVSAIEQRLSMGDVTPRGYEVKVNFDAFLRADTKTRYEAHKIALDSKFKVVDEVRDLEDLPELTAAQRDELKPEPAPIMQPTEEMSDER